MVELWDDDERNTKDYIKYENDVSSWRKDIYKNILETLEEDKFNSWNEVEYVEYAYEPLPYGDIHDDKKEDLDAKAGDNGDNGDNGDDTENESVDGTGDDTKDVTGGETGDDAGDDIGDYTEDDVLYCLEQIYTKLFMYT